MSATLRSNVLLSHKNRYASARVIFRKKKTKIQRTTWPGYVSKMKDARGGRSRGHKICKRTSRSHASRERAHYGVWTACICASKSTGGASGYCYCWGTRVGFNPHVYTSPHMVAPHKQCAVLYHDIKSCKRGRKLANELRNALLRTRYLGYSAARSETVSSTRGEATAYSTKESNACCLAHSCCAC